MITLAQLSLLLTDLESNLIERTVSIREDKLGPAICALSNDYAGHQQSGHILLGVDDLGNLAGKVWGDKELQEIGSIRTNGNILPQPSMSLSPVFSFPEGEVVVIEVIPSKYPPVRFDGRCWIRIGPRKAKASVDEERILIERRSSYAKTYDLVPAFGSSLADLNVSTFTSDYLPLAVDKETLDANGRPVEEQLAALRFFDLKAQCPTNGGILLFGKNPLKQFPGAYLQYVKFDGTELVHDVVFEKSLSGALINEIGVIEDFISNNILKSRPIKTNGFQELNLTNYPLWSLRELVMNAIMHRNYESNAPIYLYEFVDRIEIVNPGGLYGDVNANNFPNASDYRNIVISEGMKLLGYVNRFNYGVRRAIDELVKNGNGWPVFDLTMTTKFKVTVPVNKNW